MIAIQPIFVHIIAPMFNKFTPLEEGELKAAIEEFANKVSFPIGKNRCYGRKQKICSFQCIFQWIWKIKKDRALLTHY